MEKPYKYIPVIIITLNRYEHLKACIESLRNNTFAKYTDLYISLDYPPSEKYVEGHERIKQYLEKGITGFHAVFVYYQNENLGPSGNSIFLRNIVSKCADSYIFTEDDNVFSPNYIQYMCECLYKFENDPNAYAVCGHTFPIQWEGLNNIILFDTSFNAWGYASWNKKYNDYKKYVEDGRLDKALRNPISGLKVLFKDKGAFFAMASGLAGSFPVLRSNNRFRTIDISVSLYMILNKKYYIMPSITKVHNNGYDGSGINCNNYDFNLINQEFLDDDKNFSIKITEDLKINKKMYGLLNKHNHVSLVMIFKSVIIYLIYCLFGDYGIDFFKRIYHFLKREK